MTREQAKTRIDPDLKKKMERHPDSISEILREGAKIYMGGTDRKELRSDLREACADYRHINDRYDQIKDLRDEQREEVHRLARDLHEFKDPEEQYREWLNGVLDEYEQTDHPYLIPSIISGLDGFDKWSKTTDEVREDLKKLSIEQQRELCNSDFTTGHRSGSNEPLYEEYEIEDNALVKKDGETPISSRGR